VESLLVVDIEYEIYGMMGAEETCIEEIILMTRMYRGWI
jgi:hypothetical protein